MDDCGMNSGMNASHYNRDEGFQNENRQRVGARTNDGRAFHMDSLMSQMDGSQNRFAAQGNAGKETGYILDDNSRNFKNE